MTEFSTMVTEKNRQFVVEVKSQGQRLRSLWGHPWLCHFCKSTEIVSFRQSTFFGVTHLNFQLNKNLRQVPHQAIPDNYSNFVFHEVCVIGRPDVRFSEWLDVFLTTGWTPVGLHIDDEYLALLYSSCLVTFGPSFTIIADLDFYEEVIFKVM